MDKPFHIYVVGRSNVGKSSLFNALLGMRRSIVLDSVGTTLDEIGETVDWGRGEFRLVDTQGVLIDITLKGADLFSRADAFLVVVDALSGLTQWDREFSRFLLQTLKPLLLCVNKAENEGDGSLAQFAELGLGEMVTVSAAHRMGLDPVKLWCCKTQKQISSLPTEDVVRIALVGRPNVGKSTLMNRLCGESVSRVSPFPLTTRDPISFEISTRGKRIELFDTAGIRRQRSWKTGVEVFSVQAAKRIIRKSNVVLLLVASHEAITDQDLRLLRLVTEAGKPAGVLFTFWDRCSVQKKKEFRREPEFRQLSLRFDHLCVSAPTGYNMSKVIPFSLRLLTQSSYRIQTSHFNRIIKKLIEAHPPPAAGRGNFNILYSSQVKITPPTFVLFANRRASLPDAYHRYLEKEVRRELGLRNQAVRIYIRSGRDSRFGVR